MKVFTKKSQKGAGMVEYALLAALISLACIASVRSVGESARNQYCRVASELAGGGGLGAPNNNEITYDANCVPIVTDNFD